MKLKTTIYLLVSLLTFSSFAQQMPISFLNGLDTFATFGNSTFSFTVNPEDGNDQAGEFHNNGSDIWEGFYIDLNQPVDLASQQTISLSFYAFDTDTHSIIIKLENGSEPDVEVEQQISSENWSENIEFNFSEALYSGTETSVNATGSYNRLTIFIDGGTANTGTYLIDDITDGSEPYDPNALDVIYTDLVWADEFDEEGTVNSEKWHHQTQLPAGGSWFNGEQQHYTDRVDNSYVENGFLNIVAIKENYTDQSETKQYTSARLNSKFAFTYGRVDVRAKLPSGEGTWPAIWALGKNVNEEGAYWHNEYGTVAWPACGEIDIMEHGLGATNHVSSALHTACAGCSGSTMNVQAYELNDVANEFHVYSMNWSPNQITFLIDGVGFYTYNPEIKDDGTWPFYEDQYLLLNVAMGGIAGAIDPNFTQSSMVVDYVRVYQNESLNTGSLFKRSLRIYPNPASDNIKIMANSPIDSLILYNSIGQTIIVKDDNFESPILNIESLKDGIYFIKITSGNESVIKKIIIN